MSEKYIRVISLHKGTFFGAPFEIFLAQESKKFVFSIIFEDVEEFSAEEYSSYDKAYQAAQGEICVKIDARCKRITEKLHG
jgi:hypothetical protein